jgi:hypothetical protein
MSDIHICGGLTATDTPGFLADTTGWQPDNYDERRAQREMKSLLTAPCPECAGRGPRCPRCAGYGVVIVGRPTWREVTERALRELEKG